MTPKKVAKPTPSKNASAIEKIASELFNLLDLADTKIKVVEEEDNLFQINATVDPEQSGVLIGYHGETINSLQLVLSLITHQKLEEWYHLKLNINDYRDKREQSLQEMAHNAAERAKETGEEVVMPPMQSFDRRIVHMELSQDKDIRTESVGEGKDRRLIIYPTTSKPQTDSPQQ